MYGKFYTFYFKDGRPPVKCQLSKQPVGSVPHPNFGRAQTSLQKLSSERNWDIAQVKGACTSLLRIARKRGSLDTDILGKIQKILLVRIDRHWKEQKEKIK